MALVTMFYSNYSGNCKALLQLIKNSNLLDQLSIKFINIDNNDIKDIVLKKFSVVPSIVVIHEDEISLYTGNNAFEWFNMFTSEEALLNPNNTSNSLNTSIDHSAQTDEEDEKESVPDPPKSILELAAEISKGRED
ncbi:hypothetical protein IIV25_160L [Invertebrate iridovirus 25]|uniref:Thioredoxin domain-containing protein n=1 Tax=Invertebrate iridovirus 25 TaxID=1301280 RepID=W8W1M8_9VIRU|nr:hypothetical protein IIV25_160L [Invertebrate iridovirus 25]CCV02178.1 hypothetical protein IIV25_160L [Invertebrate iridovirus 25]